MVTRCADTVVSRFANRYNFLRFYENRKVLVNLKSNSNKSLAHSHLFNIKFNTSNVRRTRTTHKIPRDFFQYQYKLNVRVTSQVVKQLRK